MIVPQIKALLQTPPDGQTVVVKGWVRTKRDNKSVVFLALNDGSTIHNIQAVLRPELFDDALLRQLGTGACVAVTGALMASQGAGQATEVVATAVQLYGATDETYPIQPRRHSMEFLRTKAHLRPRTNTFAAVFRIRHALAFAVHQYFNDRGFFCLHTPIITGSDAEGAGEMFRVTTLDPLRPPTHPDGRVNYGEDFFGKETNLTVSGQLEGELGALALSKIYTFGPTFRAENSNTPRHLAEFWMIEPEMAFYELEDNANLAEDFLKHLIQYALDHCADDLAFLENRLLEEEKTKKKEEQSEGTLTQKLRSVVDGPFERLTYSEAIEILLRSKPHQKGQFQYPVAWGIDLQSEHERYLVEKHFRKPVVLTNYPRAIKAFYMKQNDDGTTVRAMDVLFPGIGEIVGGSQREDDHAKLLARVREQGIAQESLGWYLETRQYGSAPHSGFGLGFERLILFVTGMTNIRDVIPFPRTPGNADF